MLQAVPRRARYLPFTSASTRRLAMVAAGSIPDAGAPEQGSLSADASRMCAARAHEAAEDVALDEVQSEAEREEGAYLPVARF